VSQTHVNSSIDVGYGTVYRFATRNPALNHTSLMMDQSMMNMSLHGEVTTKSDCACGVSMRGMGKTSTCTLNSRSALGSSFF
jgi:hypothetical protein